MQKPITLLISDFRKNMDDVINNSKLPWWKIQDEVELVLLPQLRRLSEQEKQAELKAYLEEKQKQEELEKKREERIKQKEAE